MSLSYYLIVFSLQVLFNIFKVLEIKWTYENRVGPLLVSTVLLNLLSLGSIFYSLDRLMLGDWVVVPFFIGGAALGKWLAIKKLGNVRSRVFRKIFGG